MQYLVGVLIGALSSLIVVFIAEYNTRPKLEIVEDPSTPDNASDGSRSSYHLKVRNIQVFCLWRLIFKVRKPAWKTKTTIKILNGKKEVVIDEIFARWPSTPEPITRSGENLVIDFPKLFIGRENSIFPHEDERIDLGIKFQGENEFYFFSNESYLYDQWKNPNWRIEKGEYFAIVKVFYEYGNVESFFELKNSGSNKTDFSIRRIKKI